MKTVNSPNAFKTAYIAAVKEEMGLLKRKFKSQRKIKPPKHLKWAIAEALKLKPYATYKEIQKLAFEILKRKKEKKLPFLGVLGDVERELLESVINDKGLSYED